MVVAIDKTDDLAKAGFLGETDFTPSDRHVLIAPGCSFVHEHDKSAPCDSPLATGKPSLPLIAVLFTSMTSQDPVPFVMGSMNARMTLAFRLQHGKIFTQQRHALVKSALCLCCLRATPVLPACPSCLFDQTAMSKRSFLKTALSVKYKELCCAVFWCFAGRVQADVLECGFESSVCCHQCRCAAHN